MDRADRSSAQAFAAAQSTSLKKSLRRAVAEDAGIEREVAIEMAHADTDRFLQMVRQQVLGDVPQGDPTKYVAAANAAIKLHYEANERTLATLDTRLDKRVSALQRTLWGQLGKVSNLSNAFRHVVEQREQRQSEVRALLTQLEAVLDHAEVGIALTRDGQFELVSRQFCHIFRCEKADAIGQSTRMIYASDEDFQALIAQARPALTERGIVDAELQLMRRNGQVFWARMRGRAVVAGDVGRGTIWTIEDVTAAREQRERLAYTASHDALTGLVNRAAFERLLEEATGSVSRQSFCALFIDLDRFKQVNDTGGHAAGDALLRDIAQVLGQTVRRSDVVARLGGDEFAVLLPGCPADQARLIADKLCAAVQGYELVWNGDRFGVGASVGLVAVDESFGTSADVLRAADSACYAAKKRGRSRVEQYQASDFHELQTA